MQTPNISLWRLRLVTFAVSALAAASAVYWGLKWQNPAQPARGAPIAAAPRPVDSQRVALLLGARAKPVGGDAAPTAASSSYKLLGVIAQGGAHGSALIAVEGAPAKPFRVGEVVANELRLQKVGARSATLGAGADGDGLTLTLPPVPGQK